jgi:hypothetical protein
MAFFRVQVFKSIAGNPREWSNTYRVQATDLATVAAVLSDICNQESHLYLDNVNVTRARASDEDPETDEFVIHTANIIGDRGTAESGDWLPLFNCFRVDLDVAGGGRPSRKFYRGPLLESDQAEGIVNGGVATNIETQVAEIITLFTTGSAPWVDPQGQVITTPHCLPNVQMRQLHRKRRKAVTP